MGIGNFAGRCGLVLGLATLAATAAQAKIVLSSDSGKLTAASTADGAASYDWMKASFDKGRAAGSAASTASTVTLAKVSVQDIHYICMPSKRMAAADRSSMTGEVCRLPSLTVEDNGRVYILSDVTLTARPATGCDGTCGPDVSNVDVSYMAINEKGLPGTKTSTKGSTK